MSNEIEGGKRWGCGVGVGKEKAKRSLPLLAAICRWNYPMMEFLAFDRPEKLQRRQTP